MFGKRMDTYNKVRVYVYSHIIIFSKKKSDHFAYSYVFMNSKTSDFYKLYFVTSKLSFRP